MSVKWDNYFSERTRHITGSQIRQFFSLTERPEVISFAGGFPGNDFFPREHIARALAELAVDKSGQALQYGPTEGSYDLRELVAEKMRREGAACQADNLVIADPTDPKWENFTAPALLEVADAAITTPSTVALDAARLGRPVAVVGYDLALEKYHPLPILRKSHDWTDWVNQLTSTEGYHKLQQTGQRFLQKQTLSGDATSRIVTYVMQQML